MNVNFSRRAFLKTAVLALPCLGAGCRNLAGRSPRAGEFVVVRNRRFERGGRPYVFIGANFWRAGMLAKPDVPHGRESLLRELDQMSSIGITNLRILAGSEGPGGILISPGVWDENALAGLDFALAEMARRNMTAVLYLTNYWEWSGGMAQYVSWATGEPIPDPYQSGGKQTGADRMRFAARFYSLPRAQEMYRQHITHLLSRRNTANGRFYRSDPAIMAWQLCNEPRPGTDEPASEANLPAFYSWIDQTAHFIKSLAPTHLVSTGSEGSMGCLGQPGVFLRAHRSPAVDYSTLHVWVQNWGWLREPRLGPQYEEAASRALKHIEEHILLSEQLSKPLVLEEFGIPRDNGSRSPNSTTAMRDDYFARVFRCLGDSCKAGRSLQGADFWLWQGAPPPGHANELLDGNGVATGDATTLQVIRASTSDLGAWAAAKAKPSRLIGL